MTLAEKILVLRAGNIEQYGTPDDIYLHPASVFVAQFMGSPSMNMIPATTDGEKLILPDGTPLKLERGEGEPVDEACTAYRYTYYFDAAPETAPSVTLTVLCDGAEAAVIELPLG